jgi:GDP-D-mannose dehydratase
MQDNAVSTINIFDVIKDEVPQCKVHMCSTSEVYGNVPEDKQPITEETRIFPQNPYAISKTVGDLFAQCYFKSYNMSIFTTRAFSYTGPRKGDFFAESSFAKQIALIEKGKKEPVIKVGNLSSIRTFMDVRDVVEAYCILMEKCHSGGIYVISGDATLSMREVLDKLISMSDTDVKVEVDPALLRPVDIIVQKPDSSKIRKQFGWRPKIPIDKSLEDLLGYWREHV